EAVTLYETAQIWLSQHSRQHEAAIAAHGLGRAYARLEEHAKAQAAFDEALNLLHEAPCAEMVEVLADLATLLAVSLGRQNEGIGYGKQALHLANQLGDASIQAKASRVVGNLLVRGNALVLGIPLLENARLLAETAEDYAEATECCACLT